MNTFDGTLEDMTQIAKDDHSEPPTPTIPGREPPEGSEISGHTAIMQHSQVPLLPPPRPLPDQRHRAPRCRAASTRIHQEQRGPWRDWQTRI